MRPATGQVIERQGKRGTSYQLRFYAAGKRRTMIAGNSADGFSRRDAEEELSYQLALVKRGTWHPPEPAPQIEEPEPAPSFHEFSSEWFARHRGEWRPRTQADYRNSISGHLLPYFAHHQLGQIDARAIDKYVAAKVAEQKLAASQINKSLLRLAQILSEAQEYGLISTNPLEGRAGRRRRLRAEQPRRASLDARQARALLDASGRHRPLIATALMAGGLRVSELTALRWRDVSLASATLRVEASKTSAGIRQVDIPPDLLHELRELKARSRWNSPSDFVFAGQHRRRPRNRSSAAQLLRRLIARANEQLAAEGWAPIPEGASFHSLRRTYASLMAEAGADPSYVMKQIGHSKSSFTLEIYTDVRGRRDAANSRLGALLVGPEKARKGANGDLAPSEPPAPAERETGFSA